MNRGMQQKSDSNQRSWEDAEFPILCEGCLGDNAYVRMIVDRFNGQCKMCDRPFNVFKWKPSRGEGYRKTEVCQQCAKVKNVCQTCILDLQLGLPSQLRDAVLASSDDLAAPESTINREYITQQQLIRLDAEGDEVLANETSEKLLKIARSIATNRAQPRIKMFQAPKPSEEQVAEDRKRSRAELEADEQNGGDEILLPPGIESAEQLRRLPTSMQAFLKMQYGIVDNTSANNNTNGDSNSGGTSEKTEKVKKQKIKYFPKPPSGPPPPEALAAVATNDN